MASRIALSKIPDARVTLRVQYVLDTGECHAPEKWFIMHVLLLFTLLHFVNKLSIFQRRLNCYRNKLCFIYKNLYFVVFVVYAMEIVLHDIALRCITARIGAWPN
jgi:hypothetical protein